MKNVLRPVAGLLGVLFVVNWLGWVVRPAGAAEGLGMPLLDGVGRSTQIGDVGALFLAGAALLLVGAWRERADLLLGAAVLIGGAAFMRTLAWAVHGAAFTTTFIVVEAITAVIAFLTSRAVAASPRSPQP